MALQASGSFTVKLAPQPPDPARQGAGPGHLLIDKQFTGDLEATSQGEMLAIRTPIEGSAGYVAMETVTGLLQGRQGTFALQHSGTMDRGSQQLLIRVVPDSGTGGLQGLAGSMAIDIEGAEHRYRLTYTLPTAD